LVLLSQPWNFSPFSSVAQVGSLWRKVAAAAGSGVRHQIRIWPSIPVTQPQHAQLVAEFRHLHTLHVNIHCDSKVLQSLFRRRPFPFIALHSLSLPWPHSALLTLLPVMTELRRMALTDPAREGSSGLEDEKTALIGAKKAAKALLQEQGLSYTSMWATVLPLLPRLLYLDLPTELQLDNCSDSEFDEADPVARPAASLGRVPAAPPPPLSSPIGSALVDFARALPELRQLEASGALSSKVLTQLIAHPAPATLRCVIDCLQGGSVNQPALTDAHLKLLSQLPAYSMLAQPRSALSDLSPMLLMAARLESWIVAEQVLSAEFVTGFEHVLPRLMKLKSLTLKSIRQPAQDPSSTLDSNISEVDDRWQSLLRCIRLAPALEELELNTVPILQPHLDALVGSPAEHAGRVVEAEARAAAGSTAVQSLDDDEPAVDAAAVQPILPRLRLLRLHDINSVFFLARPQLLLHTKIQQLQGQLSGNTHLLAPQTDDLRGVNWGRSLGSAAALPTHARIHVGSVIGMAQEVKAELARRGGANRTRQADERAP
jgi:hypothetical protein